MGKIFMLDTEKRPLDPVHPGRARLLLNQGKAAVFRFFPFTIILKKPVRTPVEPLRLKIDPGSKTTGIAITTEKGEVVWAADLYHRGQIIKSDIESRRAIRRNRRNRHTRYRAPRFDNRTRPKGWLSPSLKHRVLTTMTWVNRLSRWAPIAALSMELVKFDLQKMENPEVSGIEYQQGELKGYEVREYLLEKWRRKCSYCNKKDVPLQIEHIVPRARGGTNRVSNLTIACESCNQKKGTQTAEEFGYPEIQKRAKLPLKDAAAVNTTRWALFGKLKANGLPVEIGSGGRTKFNRTCQEFSKAHWIDAACVGVSGMNVSIPESIKPLVIKATGHGSRQMCGTDKFGFPVRHRARHKLVFGFQTGDIVKAVVPKGKRTGVHTGRVLVRASGSFDIQEAYGRAAGISHRHIQIIQKKDGYGYV